MDHLLQADPDGLHEMTQDHVDRRHQKTERFEQQEKNEAEQHSSEIACGSHRVAGSPGNRVATQRSLVM